MSDIPEHSREPVPGLPDWLPAGERILWQGRPDWREFAIRALHVRKVAIYFALLMLLRMSDDAAAASPFLFLIAATAGLGLLGLLARGMARSALYTITNRRIVMRFGIAVPISLNLPFARIQSAGLHKHNASHGDIAIHVKPDERVRLSYLVLWPHARAWKLSPPVPMLRCIANADEVAQTLADALHTHVDTENVRHAVHMPENRKPALANTNASQVEPFPALPLAGAAILIAVTIASVAFWRATSQPASSEHSDAFVASVSLRFEDRADGAVAVYDANTGGLIENLPAGSNNFLRASLRGLVRSRNAQEPGDRSAFELQRLANGQLLLLDPVTGQSIDLWAFGETNARAFEKFLTTDLTGLQPQTGAALGRLSTRLDAPDEAL